MAKKNPLFEDAGFSNNPLFDNVSSDALLSMIQKDAEARRKEEEKKKEEEQQKQSLEQAQSANARTLKMVRGFQGMANEPDFFQKPPENIVNSAKDAYMATTPLGWGITAATMSPEQRKSGAEAVGNELSSRFTGNQSPNLTPREQEIRNKGGELALMAKRAGVTQNAPTEVLKSAGRDLLQPIESVGKPMADLSQKVTDLAVKPIMGDNYIKDRDKRQKELQDKMHQLLKSDPNSSQADKIVGEIGGMIGSLPAYIVGGEIGGAIGGIAKGSEYLPTIGKLMPAIGRIAGFVGAGQSEVQPGESRPQRALGDIVMGTVFESGLAGVKWFFKPGEGIVVESAGRIHDITPDRVTQFAQNGTTGDGALDDVIKTMSGSERASIFRQAQKGTKQIVETGKTEYPGKSPYDRLLDFLGRDSKPVEPTFTKGESNVISGQIPEKAGIEKMAEDMYSPKDPQVMIEEALNNNDFESARQIAETIPDNVPYKQDILQIIDELAPQGSDLVPHPSEPILKPLVTQPVPPPVAPPEAPTVPETPQQPTDLVDHPTEPILKNQNTLPPKPIQPEPNVTDIPGFGKIDYDNVKFTPAPDEPVASQPHPELQAMRESNLPEYNKSKEIVNSDAFVDEVIPIDKNNEEYAINYKHGDRYAVKVSYPHSLGENGNQIDFVYKTKPTPKEIANDIQAEFADFKKEVNKPMVAGIVAKSGRDENIEKAIDKVMPKKPKPLKTGMEKPVEFPKTGSTVKVNGEDFTVLQSWYGNEGNAVVRVQNNFTRKTKTVPLSEINKKLPAKPTFGDAKKIKEIKTQNKFEILKENKRLAEQEKTNKAVNVKQKGAFDNNKYVKEGGQQDLFSPKPKPLVKEKSKIENKITEDMLMSENAANLFAELETAQAGKRMKVGDEWTGTKSTFPQWIPEDLRNKKMLDKALDNIYKGTEPTGKAAELYNIIHDQLSKTSVLKTVDKFSMWDANGTRITVAKAKEIYKNIFKGEYSLAPDYIGKRQGIGGSWNPVTNTISAFYDSNEMIDSKAFYHEVLHPIWNNLPTDLNTSFSDYIRGEFVGKKYPRAQVIKYTFDDMNYDFKVAAQEQIKKSIFKSELEKYNGIVDSTEKYMKAVDKEGQDVVDQRLLENGQRAARTFFRMMKPILENETLSDTMVQEIFAEQGGEWASNKTGSWTDKLKAIWQEIMAYIKKKLGDETYSKMMDVYKRTRSGELKDQTIVKGGGEVKKSLTPAQEALQRIKDIVDRTLTEENASPETKSFIEKTSQSITATHNLEDDLNNLRTSASADVLRAKQFLQDNNITPKDAEAVYHYTEDKTLKLTPRQQQIYDQIVKPLEGEISKMYAKIKGYDVPLVRDEFTNRYIANRGGLLDKIQRGAKSVGRSSGLLNKSGSMMKTRVMRSLTDENGDKVVVSIKGNIVTAWRNGEGSVLGKFRTPKPPRVKEYYDKQVMDGLKKLAEDLGISHERVIKMGGNLMGKSMVGYPHIETRVATPEAVILHEIGHQLDSRYNLQDRFVKDPELKKEMRALVDLKYEGKEVSNYFKKYVRKGGEKIATLFEAYLHAPELFRETAPITYGKFTEFLSNHEETKPILELKNSMVFESQTIGDVKEPGTFTDKSGKKWTVGEATTKEIEANTKLKYHKNIILNQIVTYNKMRQMDRAIQFLENFKSDPNFADIAIKNGEGNIPDGWKMVNVLQFRDYFFEPRVADAINMFGKTGGDPLKFMTTFNHIVRNSIFFNPLIHVPNILNHWAVNRGTVKFALPQEYWHLAKSGSRAIKAVITMNEDYLEMLDSGANLIYGKDGKTLEQLMLEKMGEELSSNQKIYKALGYVNPGQLVKAIYRFSGKVTWGTNDIATMQAVYELMEHNEGMTLQEAIKHVGKHIPNYRIPSRVINSRFISEVMKNPNVTMFGAYHYGALRSYGEMVKEIVGKTPPKEKAKVMDKLVMLGLITLVVYPMLDKVVKDFTKNENAQMRRAGASTFPYNIYKLLKGQKTFSDVLQSVFTPAVGTKTLIELAFNKDLFTGEQLIMPGTSMWDNILNIAGKSLAPIGQYQKLASGKSDLKSFLLNLTGVSTPKSAPGTNTLYDLRDTHDKLASQLRKGMDNPEKAIDTYNNAVKKAIGNVNMTDQEKADWEKTLLLNRDKEINKSRIPGLLREGKDSEVKKILDDDLGYTEKGTKKHYKPATLDKMIKDLKDEFLKTSMLPRRPQKLG